MKSLTPIPAVCTKNNFTLMPLPGLTRFSAGGFLFIPLLVAFQFISFCLSAQSSDCVPGAVNNDGESSWSEQCYLSPTCEEQGNPCQANDVVLLGVFIADASGGPVNTCSPGETVSFLLWGTFYNNTGTDRYAVRSCTEVWIDGAYYGEVNSCSFDVLGSGDSEVILLGEFSYECFDRIELLNTWVGWSTTPAQCGDPSAPNFKSECGEYPPSKCSKTLVFLQFLTPNFSFACGGSGSSTTEVCFTNLSSGGTPSLTYAWDFGDGQTSIEEHPCHTFNTTSGTYNCLMTVTDSKGVQAAAQLVLNLDSLNCCVLSVNCPPVNGGIYDCITDVPAPDSEIITVIDACGDVIISALDETTGTGCGTDTMVITRTYSISDGSSLTTCTQFFKVVDDQSPVATCPDPVLINCTDNIPDPDENSIVYSDNCNGPVSITFIEDELNDQTCADRFTINRTYQVEDDCGNTSLCTQNIVVFDDTPPSISCLLDLTVSCAGNVPSPDTEAIVTSDNCGSAPTITVSPDIISQEVCANSYTITRTYTSTDICGNTTSCIQAITVLDDLAPIITCPPGITVSCQDDIPVPNTNAIIANDNCGGQISITVGADITLNQICANRFKVLRSYTATDACGNSSVCTQEITIQDNAAPTISCPANVTVACESLVPEPTIEGIISSDNCSGGVTVTVATDILSEPDCANSYTIIRIFTSTDDCGNTATCAQSITVFDNVSPSIDCLNDITVSCTADIPTPDISAIVTSDNCNGPVTVTVLGDETGNLLCSNGFIVTRTYVATDLCGNSVSCVQSITVNDNSAPAITCPGDITVACTNQIPQVDIEDVTVTDNCGGISIVSHVGDVVSGLICSNKYRVTRTYSVSDDCGNNAICNQLIDVFDDISPSINCPENITVTCSGDVPAPNIAAVVANDNCGGPVTVTVAADVTINQICSNNFVILRTFTATDLCGNTAECTQTITIKDEILPLLNCPADLTLTCADDIPLPDISTIVASDNCGESVSISVAADVTINFICENNFTITRTYLATDACGNRSSCSQTIIIIDDNPPVISCLADLTVGCSQLVPVADINAVSTIDNCSNTSTVIHVIDIISNQSCVNNYTLTRFYQSEDGCGNTSTCAQVIDVSDLTSPDIICPLDLTVQCSSQVPPVDVSSVIASDNCGGIVSVTHLRDAISNQTCENRYLLTRTYLATDECGNSASCSQFITVNDDVAPLLEFVDPLLEGLINGDTVFVQCFGQNPGWDLPQFDESSVDASENCSAASVHFTQHVEDEGDCRIDGYINLYRLTWTATDLCENSNSAFLYLALIDEIPPVIHGIPDDITVTADAIPEPSSIYATDECLCACVVLLEESLLPSGCLDGQVITRTWKATDDCGNVSMESQSITLVDDQGPDMLLVEPELVGITDGTIMEYTCNEGGLPEYFELLSSSSISFSDLSGPSDITFDVALFETNNCELSGFVAQHSYQWIASDLCDNSSSLSIQVRLIDNEAPSFVDLPDTTCIGDPALLNVYATDDCGDPHVRFWDIRIPNPCGSGLAVRRTYEAYDGCGNITTDTTILIANDQAKPVIEFVNPLLNNLDDGETLVVNCQAADGHLTPFGLSDVLVRDGCSGGVTVDFSEKLLSPGDCSVSEGLGLMELRWTASDVCFNSSTRIVTVRLVDETAPVFIDIEKEISINCDDKLPLVYASDNCGEVTITYADSIISGRCPNQYDLVRRLTATDQCDNTATEVQMIHVGGLGPVIEGVELELCDDLSIPHVTAYDPCAKQFVGIVMTQDTLESLCADGLVIERVWTARDACDNATEIRQHIIIGDDTPPEIFIPSYSIIRRFVDLDQIPSVLLSQQDIIDRLSDLNDNSITVFDDCDQEIIPVFTLETITSSTPLLDGYTYRRLYTWIATDICGNESVITFTINVIDDLPPTIGEFPSDTTIICAQLPAVYEMIPDPDDPLNVLFSESIEQGEEPGIFLVTRSWVITDMSGNSSVIVQHIKWIPDSYLACDIILPDMVECNSHSVIISSDVTGGFEPYTYLWEIEGDECFIQGGQGTPEISIYVGWTDVKIKLTVTDIYGCVTICMTTLSCLEPVQNLVFMPGANEKIVPDDEIQSFMHAVENNKEVLMTQSSYWPNPADGTLNLSMEFLKETQINLSLINLMGQVVLEENIKATKGVNYQKLDVGRLPEGSYLMRISARDESQTYIIVIMR